MAAETSAVVTWFIDLASTPAGCRYEGAEVRLDMTTLLPRWQAPERVAPGLRRRWTRIAEALRAHEQMHVAINLETARQVREAIERAKAPASPDCEGWRSLMESAARGAVQRGAARHRDLDRETQHGRRELRQLESSEPASPRARALPAGSG